MEKIFCQSCGMPMEATEDYGTEISGERSADYCHYCYKKGDFTSGISMEEMIELCVPMMANAESGLSADTARTMMQGFFPTLKRWKSA